MFSLMQVIPSAEYSSSIYFVLQSYYQEFYDNNFVLSIILSWLFAYYRKFQSSTVLQCQWGCQQVEVQSGGPRDGGSSPDRVKNFLFSTDFRLALGPTKPPNHWVLEVTSLGIKRAQREADLQTLPRSYIYPLFFTFSWRSAWLVKHRDNFTLPFIIRDRLCGLVVIVPG
jgi:hypothetical protein